MNSDPEDPGGSITAVAVTDEQTIALDVRALASVGDAVLRLLGVPGDAHLSVTLVEPDRIAELKERALGERAATDVLSFPMDDPWDPMPGPVVLGDVVICPAVAARQARALGRRFDDEMTELLVHGILHVLGRDHADPASERAMADEQRRIVEAIRTGAAA